MRLSVNFSKDACCKHASFEKLQLFTHMNGLLRFLFGLNYRPLTEIAF